MSAELVIYGAGPRDPVALNPDAIQFKTEPRKSCRCCLFHGQWVNVCNQAAEVAAMRGMPNCDDGHVYVAVEVDPRQLILSGTSPAATGEAPDQLQRPD